jgi:hypothetical protein
LPSELLGQDATELGEQWRRRDQLDLALERQPLHGFGRTTREDERRDQDVRIEDEPQSRTSRINRSTSFDVLIPSRAACEAP